MRTQNNRWIGLFGAALFAALASAQQQAQQQGVFDKAAILRELDKLDQAHRDKLVSEQKSVGDLLAKALSNNKAMLEFYEEAIFATRFEGAKKDNAEFKKWKNEQEDTLKSDDFQAALSLHVNYLNLTFRRASGEEEAKLVEELSQHVLKIWALESKFDLHKRSTVDILDRPVNQGVIARRHRLGPKLGGPVDGEKLKDQDKTWEWNPGNSDGMLDRTVFPYLRKVKSPVLVPFWDKRIANEAAHVKRAGLSDKATLFAQQTLPRLQWQRAGDLILLGREAEGFTTMIDVLRQNPRHPEFEKFIAELRGLLSDAGAPHT